MRIIYILIITVLLICPVLHAQDMPTDKEIAIPAPVGTDTTGTGSEIKQVTPGARAEGTEPKSSSDNSVNEDEMFASPETVIGNSTLEKKDVDADQDKKHLGVSGQITSVNQYYMSRNTFSRFSHDGNVFNPYMDGVLFLDARLPAGIKGFGNFEAIYNARTTESLWSIRELFVDFNISRKVYIRTGKQVLQWGRCYLWNPTDLVNVEKKTFLQKIGSREGAYGIKGQVSFGTDVNMYAFADTAGAEDMNRIGGAYKLEFLVKTTEMAVSVWGKEGYNPVMGYDISTRLLGIDISAEASLSPGSNMDHVTNDSGTLKTTRDDSWTAKACIDFGRAFKFNDQPDKIQVNLEFFYNGEGYGSNIFSNNKLYAHESDITITNPDGTKSTIPAGYPVNKTAYILGNNLYQPNYYARYYAALFTTVNNFITSNFSLRNNLVSNIEQKAFILSSGIDYSSINDFKAGLSLNAYLGKKNTEYTFMNNALEVLITAGIVF